MDTIIYLKMFLNNILKLNLLFLVLLLGSNCKKKEVIKDTPKFEVGENKLGEVKYESGYTPQKFEMPYPSGCYFPNGLRELNALESYKAGIDPNFRKNFTIKNCLGEVVGSDFQSKSEVPMYMQMFADQSGKVVEGVVFEVTEEIKNKLKEK